MERAINTKKHVSYKDTTLAILDQYPGPIILKKYSNDSETAILNVIRSMTSQWPNSMPSTAMLFMYHTISSHNYLAASFT